MQLEATAELRDPEMNPAKKALLEVRPSLVPGADGKYKFFSWIGFMDDYVYILY